MSQSVQSVPSRAQAERPGRKWRQHLWLAPTGLVLIALTIYPTLYMLYVSFFRWPVIPTLPREFVGLGNYTSILTDPSYWNSMKVTAIFCVLAVSIELVLGYVLAAALRSDNPAIRPIRALFLLPMMIAPVVVGLLWKFMLLLDLGVVNYLLSLIGIAKVAWLGDMSMVSILMIDIWQWTPFVMLIILSGMESLPAEPFEAARVDGANAWLVFRHLTLPMLLPLITIALLFRTFDAIKTFDIVYMVTKGGPGNATTVLSYDIWRKGFVENQLGYAAALSVLAVIIVTVLAQLYFRAIGRQIRAVEE